MSVRGEVSVAAYGENPMAAVTNRYAEINTQAKLAALRATEPPSSSPASRTTPAWRSDQALLDWLASL